MEFKTKKLDEIIKYGEQEEAVELLTTFGNMFPPGEIIFLASCDHF